MDEESITYASFPNYSIQEENFYGDEIDKECQQIQENYVAPNYYKAYDIHKDYQKETLISSLPINQDLDVEHMVFLPFGMNEKFQESTEVAKEESIAHIYFSSASIQEGNCQYDFYDNTTGATFDIIADVSNSCCYDEIDDQNQAMQPFFQEYQ